MFAYKRKEYVIIFRGKHYKEIHQLVKCKCIHNFTSEIKQIKEFLQIQFNSANVIPVFQWFACSQNNLKK